MPTTHQTKPPATAGAGSWQRSRDAISRLSELIAIVDCTGSVTSKPSVRPPPSPSKSKRPRGATKGAQGGAASSESVQLPQVPATPSGRTPRASSDAPTPVQHFADTAGEASPVPSPPRHATPGSRPSTSVAGAREQQVSPALSVGALQEAASPMSPKRVTPLSESAYSLSPNRSVDKITGGPRPQGIAVLPRAPRAVESPHDIASSPQRAAIFVHNHLAPWEKASTWRALRSDQVDIVSREAHAQLSPSRRAPSREAREVQEYAQRTAAGSVPGTFFTRMILRGAPQDSADHRGGHMQVASRRRQVDSW
eukprot:CAMPEP_0174830978 /NCGR_PEP_ID=MMETSP1114-20130205/2834_1 /TAXON_ID=312471 /ORGANISM="Neobodo designis, Strain CCAP 1951/1" /LENGTH=309 /DNA_ID=CAMNT_0016064791 /DNA_START=29 /DNA_END=958 /DNA_ORIENTATION=-